MSFYCKTLVMFHAVASPIRSKANGTHHYPEVHRYVFSQVYFSAMVDLNADISAGGRGDHPQ
jgi:hypothetical protein